MEVKVFSENGRVLVTVMLLYENLDSPTHDTFLIKANELITAAPATS